MEDDEDFSSGGRSTFVNKGPLPNISDQDDEDDDDDDRLSLPPPLPDLDNTVVGGGCCTSSPTTSDRISEVKNAVLSAISDLGLLQNGTGLSVTNASHTEPRYLELTKDKPVKLQVRILVPVKEHPKFNFVGKLLGPKGNSLKRLQEETLTKMAILGRGSMRDKAKEAELRQTNDRKFAHLNEDLHIEISTFAPPAEAYARISHALLEIKRFMVPDYNDDIRQDQFRELAYINGNPLPTPPPPPPPPPPPIGRRPPPGASLVPARSSRVGLLATPSGRAVIPPPPSRSVLRSTSAVTYRSADSRLRVDDDYVYDDNGYVYAFDERRDPYYDYVTPSALDQQYADEYGEGWRRAPTEAPLFKAPRPSSTRSGFRDHPYAPLRTTSSSPQPRF